jgi:vitamin B12 transporter
MSMRIGVVWMAVVWAFGSGTPSAGAQAEADRAPFDACLEAMRSRREADARALGTRAEAHYRRLVSERPGDVDARILLARTLAQCRLPLVETMERGALVGQANSLLEAALEIDPLRWEGRFLLAMNHFHAPEFLGRTGDAQRELEMLLAQQGDRSEPPQFAETYLYLGDVYVRRGRRQDAVAVWSRGLARFPTHAALRERLSGADPGGGTGRPPGQADPIPLAELVVEVSGGSRLDDPHSGVALRRLDVLTTPGGAADLMQALRTGPGTTAATEGSDLYVRGGDPAEAPVWIDGIRVFHPGRYESLNGSVFGILDPVLLRFAYFSSGGFSVRYGNALSGVLDVQTADLPTARGGHVALNTVQAAATLNLPLGEPAGAWGGVRLSDASALLAMNGRGDEFSLAPRAFEGIGALIWLPGGGVRIKASGMVDGDRFARNLSRNGHVGPFESRGSNGMLGVSGAFVDGSGRLAVRGSLSAVSRRSGFGFGVLDQERTDRSTAVRADGEYALHPRARLRAGVEIAGFRAAHGGSLPTTDRLAPGSPVAVEQGREATSHRGGYAEGEAKPHPRLALIAGIRADRLPGEEVGTLDPRLALALGARDNWTIRVGGGVFHQGRWRTRYAVPDGLTPSGTPRRATHRAAGIERRGEPAARLEVYAKEYGDYVASGSGPPIVAGRARGADAIVRWSRQERLNGWLTYSLLQGRVDLEGGSTVPSPVDVTHGLTAVGTLDLRPGWQLGATSRAATGRPYSAPGGAPHADRLPTYRRLDLRVTRFGTLRNRVLVHYLELLNVLDHENVNAYTFDAAGERVTVPAFHRRTAIAGFTYSF